jgi:hypothetical protein
MADKKKGDDVVVQHTPAHLAEDANVFDPRHPAASAFAPMQPALGVVADDADEKGQNLAGGPKASDANADNQDQADKLAQQHKDTLVEKSGVADGGAPMTIEGDKATPAKQSADKRS